MNPTHTPPVDVEPTPADILRGAARYLQLHGWIQGSLYAGTPSDAAAPVIGPAACAQGAIGMAAFGHRIQAADESRAEWRDYQRASNALADYLELTGATGWNHDGDPISVGDWNDVTGRTADEVIAALNTAADEWERQHTPPGGERR
jgi:hypothetical protein